MDKLREEFEKETGNEAVLGEYGSTGNPIPKFTYKYTLWLESRLSVPEKGMEKKEFARRVCEMMEIDRASTLSYLK